MKPEFKKIVEGLGYQLNITLLEEQLENICEAVVLECTRMIESRETAIRSHSMTRGMDGNLTAVREDILNHFGIEQSTKS